MKQETAKNALNALLGKQEKKKSEMEKRAFASSVIGENWRQEDVVSAAAISAHRAALEFVAADLAFRKIPKQRRDWAIDAKAWIEKQAQRAARLGGEYSGHTTTSVCWGEKTDAATATGYGDKYSRSCKYSKTDATHGVTLCVADAVRLAMYYRHIADASAADGLPVIGARDGGGFVWVRPMGKKITAETGWIGFRDGQTFHSTKSAADAAAGLARKLKKAKREADDIKHGKAIERRARLVARLCGGIVATVSDALKMGYCEPGIASFQAKHGIGDSASLPQLVRTGNPAAVQLAMKLARAVSKKQERKTA